MARTPSDIHAVALLDDPVRRTMYEWVGASGREVSRDEVAAATQVSRALAAFHLDKLVDAGLLSIEFRRLSGRAGPGAGRPSKLYRRATGEIAVSLPDRRYETAARLLADAIDQPGGESARDALRSSARSLGQSVGSAARRQAGPRPGRKRLRDAFINVLEARGYEPRSEPSGAVRLRNCPFDALVADHRSLVCGMNLAMADGLIEGLGDAQVEARMDPQPGQCCVAFDVPSGR